MAHDVINITMFGERERRIGAERWTGCVRRSKALMVKHDCMYIPCIVGNFQLPTFGFL